MGAAAPTPCRAPPEGRMRVCVSGSLSSSCSSPYPAAAKRLSNPLRVHPQPSPTLRRPSRCPDPNVRP